MNNIYYYNIMNPKNWPENIKYTNKLLDENKLDTEQYNIQGVYIDEIIDEKHPVYGQKGLFSKRRWEKFEVIGNYCGIICDPSATNKYVARLYHDLSSEETLCINALECGNELRYINDYRNIAEEPNTKFISSNINGNQQILVIVTKDILPYTEILIDYGVDYWNYWNEYDKKKN